MLHPLLLCCLAVAASPPDAEYAIVVSEATANDPQWSQVVDALRKQHNGEVVTYKETVDQSLASLRQRFPRYTCFVVKPTEATRDFVASVHQLTRKFDDDPYTDTLWGILTGFNADGALAIARQQEPLTVRKVASGTELAMEMVDEGVWYCELKQHRMVEKKPGEPAEEKKGPADTTKALVDTLNQYHADLFVTSGHATERDWQIGFRYRNGSFRSKKGELFGVDTDGEKHPVQSPNPKVYLPIGNCLMGHIDGPDAMALAWMHSAGVHQMIGYTVPTWFGYGGWGCLDYFLEQPGRYTFVEAFHANHHALIYCLENKVGMEKGLRFDRDVVALYGDPAWQARMAERPKAYDQTLVEEDGLFTLTIVGRRGERSFQPVNTNGSQRGWRPIVQFLPYRVQDVEILEDNRLSPVISDDFILVPNPRQYDRKKTYVVKFKAKRVATRAASRRGASRPATVLLVTADKLAEAWRPFARWKTRLGKATKIVTVAEIQKQYEGDDVQQKIRACCLDHVHNHGTRWVILGGDSQPGGKGLVPDRDTLHDCRFARYKDIPTDGYYISEKSWDADSDGVYGDWKQDKEEIAYTNDRATIGRIPVRTAADVAAYTTKVIAYETKYPTTKFAGNMVYTCPEAGAYPKLNTSTRSLAAAWKEGNVQQFFAHKSPWDAKKDGDHDLTPENWLSMINQKKTGKMHVHGHGFLPVWVLEGRRTLDAAHVDKLSNEDAYLTMTTVSCFTGHYDARQDPSITESMLRRPNGGAVLIVAPSRQGVPVFHDPSHDFRLMVTEGKMDGTTRTLTRFWHHALTKNLTAGEALSVAKAEMVKDAEKTAGFHFLQCELNLLGDPTLDLRSRDPRTPKLEFPTSLSTGRHAVTVSTDAPDSTICLWKDDEVYEVVTADRTGNAVIDIVPKSAGQILVSVYGPNLNVAQGEIEVRP